MKSLGLVLNFVDSILSNSASDGQYRFLTNPYTSYLNGADTDCLRTRNYRYEFDSGMRTPKSIVL
jgi:hypothetical protein